VSKEIEFGDDDDDDREFAEVPNSLDSQSHHQSAVEPSVGFMVSRNYKQSMKKIEARVSHFSRPEVKKFD